MRRPRFLSPSQSWSSSEQQQQQQNSDHAIVMTTSFPQSPTSTVSSRPGSRDTGFPEPFNGDRNTTLPHPEANLSPDACITADDISVAKVFHRSRRSFLSKSSRRAVVSHGKIAPGVAQMYSGSTAALVESEEGESPPPALDKSDPLLGQVVTQDGSVGRASSSLNGDDDYPPAAKQVRTSEDSPGSPKRRGVLGKLKMSSK
ncbi:uncharacterized protein E0L32_005362 [Thyridium curvatum]|uniref:Uncharacterized protein n=1 Tax=Thyridium curvatum TaxID=1093900 RepID=A0A507BC28_9PEZI|nr:uncharacterized protein E0L32_005362 [Thyridium curvatum]TPX14398.1 hypothetical protein E0L32_005362 [Thyridium curvatum]